MPLIKNINEATFLSDEYPFTKVTYKESDKLVREWVCLKFFTFDKEQRQIDAAQVWPYANIYGSLRPAYPTAGQIDFYHVQVTGNEVCAYYKVKTYKRAVKLVKRMRKKYMAAIRKLGMVQ